MATIKETNNLLAREVSRFIFLLKTWEQRVFSLQGGSTGQTKVNVNAWLNDLELIYKNNMPQIDVLGGMAGFTISNEELNRIGGLGRSRVSRDSFSAAYRSRITALASKELVKARGLRNSLALRWKENSNEFFDILNAIDLQDKQGIGLTSSQRAKRFLDSGIGRLATGVTVSGKVKNGIITGTKIWKPETYALMYARTRSREMEDEIHEDEIENAGVDIVKITNANTTTPICLQFENKIFSLTGATKGLPVLEFRPPFHPKCRHRVRAMDISIEDARKENRSIDKNVSKLNKTYTSGQKKSIRKQESWISENRPTKAA